MHSLSLLHDIFECFMLITPPPPLPCGYENVYPYPITVPPVTHYFSRFFFQLKMLTIYIQNTATNLARSGRIKRPCSAKEKRVISPVTGPWVPAPAKASRGHKVTWQVGRSYKYLYHNLRDNFTPRLCSHDALEIPKGTWSKGPCNLICLFPFVNCKVSYFQMQSNLCQEVTFGTKKKWSYKRFISYEIIYDRTRQR